MHTARIERLSARAALDDPGPALAEARKEAASGDPSWTEWLDEYARGDAIIGRLWVGVDFDRGSGARERVECVNGGLWLESEVHPAKLEEQIRQVAFKDFADLQRALTDRGAEISLAELEQMYVHVELADDLRAELDRLAPC